MIIYAAGQMVTSVKIPLSNIITDNAYCISAYMKCSRVNTNYLTLLHSRYRQYNSAVSFA